MPRDGSAILHFLAGRAEEVVEGSVLYGQDEVEVSKEASTG